MTPTWHIAMATVSIQITPPAGVTALDFASMVERKAREIDEALKDMAKNKRRQG